MKRNIQRDKARKTEAAGTTTAGKCAGDWSIFLDRYELRLAGGRTCYEDAELTRGGLVMLRRLEIKDDGTLHQVNRFVTPDTVIELVPFRRRNHRHENIVIRIDVQKPLVNFTSETNDVRTDEAAN